MMNKVRIVTDYLRKVANQIEEKYDNGIVILDIVEIVEFDPVIKDKFDEVLGRVPEDHRLYRLTLKWSEKDE